MIRLDHIVQIFDLPVYESLWAFAFGLQLRDRNAIGWCLVGVDDGLVFPIL